MNYFSILCFCWAAVGVGSRIVMALMGPKWKIWELNNAYAEKRPAGINIIIILGVLLVIFTWYKVFVSDVKLGWIIAAMVTLTTVKLGSLIFNYEGFRRFASQMLNSKTKMMFLNLGVIVYSIILVTMGLFLY